MEIRLLTASVDHPLPLEEGQKSTSLVRVDRLAPVRISSPKTDTTFYPQDDYVWSVTTADDGSFHFSATPRKTLDAQGTFSQSSQSEDTTAEYIFGSPWTPATTRNAVAQYQFYASMSTAASQPSLSVYA